MGRSDAVQRAAELLNEQRWAALASVGEEGAPLASMVAYALDGQGALLLHLSRLAEHTRNLLARPTASLAVSETDGGRDDPQQLARLSLQGRVAVIPRDDAGFASAREAYLARLPDATPLFDFPDFVLFRLLPHQARFVGGFGRAFTLGPGELPRLLGPADHAS